MAFATTTFAASCIVVIDSTFCAMFCNHIASSQERAQLHCRLSEHFPALALRQSEPDRTSLSVLPAPPFLLFSFSPFPLPFHFILKFPFFRFRFRLFFLLSIVAIFLDPLHFRPLLSLPG